MERWSIFSAWPDASPPDWICVGSPWIVAAVIAFFLLRGFVVEVFQIPSESMRPALLVSDRVLVSKTSQGQRPERWKVTTFKQAERTLVKRAVAFEGEKIAIYRGEIWVDGAVLEKPDDLRRQMRFPGDRCISAFLRERL